MIYSGKEFLYPLNVLNIAYDITVLLLTDVFFTCCEFPYCAKLFISLYGLFYFIFIMSVT